jgi:hypothetical protein
LSATFGGWLFSPGTPVSSTNKNDHHDITEILLKVVLNTINPNLKMYILFLECLYYSLNVYTIPWMFILFLECLYYSLNVYTIPWMCILFLECLYYSLNVYTIPWMFILFLECVYYSLNVYTIPWMCILFLECVYYSFIGIVYTFKE